MSSPTPLRAAITDPVVSIEHARVDLGGRTIFADVGFTICDGELVAILGPNGAGKSTLLKLLLGLVKPVSGRISVIGQPAGRANTRIGYVPQFRAIEAETTLRARDVVRLGLDGHRWGTGWPSRAREKRIDDVLDEVDGRELAQAAMGELSGGERQRLLIAQALLSDPRLLLLDEPLASLDLGREQEIIALIRRICRSRNVAVLFVTHDVNPLLSDLDSVLYLANGRSAIGRPKEVITRETLSDLYGTPVEVVNVGGEDFRRGRANLTAMIELLRYPFFVNALITGSAVSISAAASGYFMISRRATFAGHALPNIGFAGAAGAVLLGIEPVYGLFVITISAALAMGLLGRDLQDRDVTVGVLMTFALGLGFLFLSLYSGYAQRVYGILFGSILGISVQAVRLTVVAAAVSLAALAFLYRPLLFSTFDPELAQARGVPVAFLSVLFLVVLALIVCLAVQVMGALLLFTLMVGPAATATRIVKNPPLAIALSVVLGLLYVVLGILIAAAIGILPVSFCVATLSFIVYLPARLFLPVGRRSRRIEEGAAPARRRA